ncbi:MAG: shikimate dehydrogenase [Saprospiraceae bacterium]|nr:shikimate dehydrogenase [Saprospiraceae bacterium]
MKEHLYGLIGYPLTHSFSKRYFSEKFEKEGLLHCRYELFPMETIELLPELLKNHPTLRGLNVTIPYKQAVLPFLDEFGEGIAALGAVNVIDIAEDGKLTGHNTDIAGFEYSLKNLLGAEDPGGALVLGTGGASKAVQFVLSKMKIPFHLVSRDPEIGFHYDQLTPEIVAEHRLIVNTTPLGMSPHTETCPKIPFEPISQRHLLFDLVYNPEETLFLKKGRLQGAQTQNGLEMLYTQAEKAWAIWNK